VLVCEISGRRTFLTERDLKVALQGGAVLRIWLLRGAGAGRRLRHGEWFSRNRDRSLAPSGEKPFPIGLSDPAGPRTVSLPDGRAHNTRQEHRAAEGDLDIDPGAVIGALREIHACVVGRERSEVKRQASHRTTGIRSGSRNISWRPRPPQRADVSTTPPVHALP